MANSWLIMIGGGVAVLIGLALALGPWVAGIALAIALAFGGILLLVAAPAARRADEEGVTDSPGQPGREPTPPAEPSH
jgi:hypothetical protein